MHYSYMLEKLHPPLQQKKVLIDGLIYKQNLINLIIFNDFKKPIYF